jgi:hypothetical protein
LNSFTKIKKDGEGACIQIVMTPAGSSYHDRYQKTLEKIKEGTPLKDALPKHLSFGGEVASILTEIFGSSKKKE